MTKWGPADDALADYREVKRHRGLNEIRSLGRYLALAAAGILLATTADRTTSGLDADVIGVFEVVPRTIAVALLTVLQVLWLVVVLGVPIALAVTRRFASLGRVALAAVLAPITLAALITVIGIDQEGSSLHNHGALAGSDWPPTSALAAYAATAAVLGPSLPGRWKRAVWVFGAVLAATRIVTATSAPLDVLLAFGVGGGVGALLLLALGRTTRVLTERGVRSTLAGSGLDVPSVETSGDARGVFVARGPEVNVNVQVIDEHTWQRERLTRAYRRVRLRRVGDLTGYRTARQAVGATAMLELFAHSQGVRTPLVRAIAQAPAGEVLLATDTVAGTRLSELEVSPSAEILAGCWHEVVQLRTARIAHRSLNLAHLVVGDDGVVWVTGLETGQIAADDDLLAGDVAELLAATAPRVGPETAVAAAIAALGYEPVQRAVPRLVPAALSAPTRTALTEDTLAALVTEVCRVTGIDTPSFVDVERIKPRVLLMAAALGVAIYVLGPRLVDLPGMLATMREVDPIWVAPILLASAATYVGAALGLAGGTPGRIPVLEAGAVALASSFVATFAPPGIGQVGLNVRYLQKRGYATPVAVSASAAKETAVLVVHLALLLAFALWAGRSGALSSELDKLPPGHVLATIGGSVVAAVGLLLAIPRVRHALRGAVVPAVRSSLDAMREVIASPAKLVTLFAGVSLLPMGYAATLFFSVQAFGGGLSFATVALVSLTAGSVATAAPTPGGIGAVEAVLLAALTGVGLASAPALAAVFTYRLATFWLPIAPGAVALRVMTRHDVL